MQIEKGKFEIPNIGRARNGKYSKIFNEFAHGNEQMMKVTFDSDKKARDCYYAFNMLTKRCVEFNDFKVLKRKLEVYVIREG